MRNKIIQALIALIALLGGGYGAAQLGAINDGQAYNATSTYSKIGLPTFATNQVIKTTGGVLGTVNITGAVAGGMIFMDATSTTDIGSTTLAVFPASTAVGNYILDVTFGRGLIVETSSGLLPTTTITWK